MFQEIFNLGCFNNVMPNLRTLKTTKHIFLIFLLISFIMNISCRKEEIEFEQAPPEDTLTPNSQVANLMQRTAMNDGSIDNIIDYANCFSIQLPVAVIVNSIQLTVNSNLEFASVEAIFDEFNDDSDSIEIIFPITIILNDFSHVNINSMSELSTYADTCNGENEMDDDIECIDFQYPILASIYNTNNELISSVSLTNDEQMYNFIEDIDANDIVSIDFPMMVVASDGTILNINNLNELRNVIETYADACDEDDDYDYNDDDCNACSPNQLRDILTNCSDWVVDKLERNNNNYDDAYDGYLFNFFTDGTVTVADFGNFYYGTWTTSGTGNNITLDINIPGLNYCNLNWNLHEIDQNSSETKVDLRVGDTDRMRYETNCN